MNYFKVFFFILSICTCKLLADPTPEISRAKQAAISLEKTFGEIYNRVSPSVVSIATERIVRHSKNNPYLNNPFFEHYFGKKNLPTPQKQKGLGSGIILSKDGYILTNAHVVQKMSSLTVKLKNSKSYPAKLIGSDRILDLAILKIKTKKSLIPVAIGDSSRVKVGNWALAIGAPLGFEQSLTVGIISSISRANLDSSGLSYIQTDASINQGNSGGPLLNIKGEVIGINRMIASRTGGSVGIGFTIPINNVMAVVEELKKKGKVRRPWIGVGLDKISKTEQKRKKIKSRKGAIIRQVLDGTPAQKIGLKVNDIIIRVGKKKVDSPADVIREVRKAKIGKRLQIVVIRKRSIIKMLIIPEERP